MKIIIAGAGEVGNHLAKMLSGGHHDITVIDADARLLDDVEGMSDIVTIEGDCTTFATLRKASVIIAAILAKQLGARKSIARIDNNEYLEPNNKEMFMNLGIDYLFYPEKIAAREVINLLGHTSTTEYVDFSGGRLALVVFPIDASSEFTGKTVADINALSGASFRPVAISRDDKTIIPHSRDMFYEGDTVYIITNNEAAKTVMNYSGKTNVSIKNLMILGGSRIGVRIATELQDELNVKLIEYNPDKAYKLAETLDRTLIINEDGRDIDAMTEEGITSMDAFVAVTGRSETNILTAMLAKRMGVKKVIAEVENLTYINLAESIGIDTIVNKKQITASRIFRFTMDTDVQAIKCLTGSEAEVLEFVVKPDAPITKSTLRHAGFPDNAIIGGIVRGDKVFIPDADFRINAYDRAVVFSLPGAIPKIGKYFN
ncbi:MAG: Trk system potassium transport protein TrkA [Alistipes sp. 56_11]|nr:MAG: Trk system potassium transport protein TrkA [Alistipes sp. 56_11]